jgi:hypothetical protein
MVKKTGSDTHVATQRGYAVDSKTSAGLLVEPGEFVPADVPVSEEWMKPVKAGDRRLMDAVQEGLDPLPKDVDLTKLDKSALQAMAAERGINVDGLSKADLVTAVKAADDPAR